MPISRCLVNVERLNGGEPIIAPNDNRWENGVTFNSAALFLERSAAHDPIIARMLGGEVSLDDPRLRDGVVALHYRARPKEDPGFRWTRSFVGLAVFTPEFELLRRLPEPVICPGENPRDYDHLGVEDPRVTPFEGAYYAVYCGLREEVAPKDGEKVNVPRNCLARSRDLVEWDSLGQIQGEVNFTVNKDGVLLPDRIGGHCFLLHRPVHPRRDIHLAMCDRPEGVWKNCGTLMTAFPNPRYQETWIGAGSVPIPLDEQRYLMIYHVGNQLTEEMHRATGHHVHYDLHAAILDFKKFTPEDPAAIVEKRMEPLMIPQTPYEVDSPFPDSVGNVLFTCGSYEHGGFIYIIYGGGDTYILAARVNKNELLEALDQSDNNNPYL